MPGHLHAMAGLPNSARRGTNMVENVPPTQVWEALQNDPQARLVDVRTDAEWAYVGLPDLGAAGKQPIQIPWQIFPAMPVNAAFVEQAKQAGLTPAHRIYFLCRSGVRSLAAAKAMADAGFPHVYNLSLIHISEPTR